MIIDKSEKDNNKDMLNHGSCFYSGFDSGFDSGYGSSKMGTLIIMSVN